jgi:hypothetical protein
MSLRATTETFVGRAAELGALRAAVERASSGDSATVLVSGEAGVGKSRLVEELMGTARWDGVLVLLGRWVDVGDGEARVCAGRWRVAVARRAGRRGRARCGPRVRPGGAGASGAGPGRRAHCRGSGPAAFGKDRLFEFLLAALGRLGRRRPVVLVVEDLHWADASTRDLLRFLVRSAA